MKKFWNKSKAPKPVEAIDRAADNVIPMKKPLSKYTFTELVDSSMHVFKEYMGTCILGELLTMHKLLAITFNQLNSIRADAMKKVQDGEIPKDDPQLNSLLQSLYPKMQLVEEKYCVIGHRIEEITSKPFDMSIKKDATPEK